MDLNYAKYLLEKTRQDYNLIAKDYARLRRAVPSNFKNWLINYISNGEKILDWGCGNGRFYEILKNKPVNYYGVDVSEKLIEIAKKNHPQGRFRITLPLKLPFPDNFFDKIFSFAVLHHIPSEEFRIQFLKEGNRVLKPDGLLILTVWDLNPLNMILTGKWQRFFAFFNCLTLKIFGKLKLDFKDFYVPWGEVTKRYVHWFTKNELKKIAEKSGFKIEEIGILKSQNKKEANIYLIAKK